MDEKQDQWPRTAPQQTIAPRHLTASVDHIKNRGAGSLQGVPALLFYEDGSTVGAKAQASTRGTAKKGAAQKRKRAPMSPETRAKIAAAARARHGKSHAG